jgi:hypothetical protein
VDRILLKLYNFFLNLAKSHDLYIYRDFFDRERYICLNCLSTGFLKLLKEGNYEAFKEIIIKDKKNIDLLTQSIVKSTFPSITRVRIKRKKIIKKSTKEKSKSKLKEFEILCVTHDFIKNESETIPDYRNKLLRVIKWFIQFVKGFNKCSNPQCQHNIHENEVLERIFKNRENFLGILHCIENDVWPIFLCCDCIKQKNEILKFEIFNTFNFV